MREILPKLRSDVKHEIDFSLVPFGIILIEFSVFTTQLSKDSYGSLQNLVFLRLAHTALMLVLAALLSHIFIRLRLTELNYRTIAITGTLVIAIGDVIHRFLGPAFDVELVSIYRRIGIVLLQGCFWFPAFIIIGSKRTQIFEQFKEYEQRIIINTRVNSRTSDQFKASQRELQQKIKIELSSACDDLVNSITNLRNSVGDISTKNRQIQPILLGEDLRKLSMQLETFGSEHQSSSVFKQNLSSVKLLVKQFQILFEATVKNAPLHWSTYSIVLIALVTPAYLNYFSLIETLISFPLVSVAIMGASYFIPKTLENDSQNSLRNFSILIFLTGFIPFLSNQIGQLIYGDPRTRYPMFIAAVILPLSYYMFMKIIQVLHPHSLELIRSDQLKASSALQNTVSRIVSEEFSHALSHRWAIYIHGKILTRLAASALKLETACISEDSTKFDETIDSLIALLKNPDAEFEQEVLDLGSEIRSRLDPWLGLLNIQIEIDSDLEKIRSPRVKDLGEVIEELVSNSMRHGKAESIVLRVIRSGDNNILIKAIDDSSVAPVDSNTRYGLGTRIFNLASDGKWSIERVELETVFTLEMSLEF
jgi:signal transduction histidine kinase